MNNVKHPFLLFMLLCMLMVYPQIMGRTASQSKKEDVLFVIKVKKENHFKKNIDILKDSLSKEKEKFKKNIIIIIKQQDTLKKYNVKKIKQ